ncbi:MAG: hypothetical protein R3A44_20240 [Caldilineaceae bacterium]
MQARRDYQQWIDLSIDAGLFRLPAPDSLLAPFTLQATMQHQHRQQEATNPPTSPPPEVLALVEQRTAARANKEWDEADRLRDAIAQAGWQLMDTPDGPNLEPL